MLKSDEPIKEPSDGFFNVVKQTHTRLLTITRTKLQALCSPDKDTSDLSRLKWLSDRPRFNYDTGEHLKQKLMPRKRSAVVRCTEETGRSYWKTGKREHIDQGEIVYFSQMKPPQDEWEDVPEV
ncbi:MAG TPA: hypothetical protein V6C81_09725 [Planktothrix sp.]|jgi:hypothetical protein